VKEFPLVRTACRHGETSTSLVFHDFRRLLRRAAPFKGLPNQRASVQRVGVRTSDFRLSYRLLALLRRLDRSVVLLEANTPTPSDVDLVLCAEGEQGTCVRLEHLEEDLLLALRSGHPSAGPSDLIVAVDPGPRPGVVWTIDKVEAGQAQLEHPDEVLPLVLDLLQRHPDARLRVRVGDGAAGPRNRILKSCLSGGCAVELVDERRTSKGLARHDHIGAARRILRSRGRHVERLPPDPAWDGVVREVKRRSREWSDGRLTLPRHLALLVATGDLSMADAVAMMDDE